MGSIACRNLDGSYGTYVILDKLRLNGRIRQRQESRGLIGEKMLHSRRHWAVLIVCSSATASRSISCSPRKPGVRSWQKPEVSDTGKTIFRGRDLFNMSGVIAAERNQNRSSRQNETTVTKAFPASLPAFVLGSLGAGIHRSGCGEKVKIAAGLCSVVLLFVL